MYSIATNAIAGLGDFGGVKAKICAEGLVPSRVKGKWKCKPTPPATPPIACAPGECLKRWQKKNKWKWACVPCPAGMLTPTMANIEIPPMEVLTSELAPAQAETSDGLPTWAWGVIGGGAALALLGGAFVVIKRRKAASV